jgi:cytochrome oxidase Cu insertion factor (SCO1/SenC/PrrC family)
MAEMRSPACALILCVVASVVLASELGCNKSAAGRLEPAAAAVTSIGHKPLQLLDLAGEPFDLWQIGAGRVSVVLFTRTDCPISNRLIPEVCHLHEVYHLRGVDFYFIYVDPHESPEDIRRHLQEYRVPCQALRDPRHDLAAYCQATITPEAIVFDKDEAITYRGRVNDLYVDLGRPRAEPTTHDLADAIEATVLGRPVSVPTTAAVGCKIEDLAY